MGSKIFDILGSIIVLATISTLVINGKNTGLVAQQGGAAFANVLKTAQGR
jgi:hypothetical protein